MSIALIASYFLVYILYGAFISWLIGLLIKTVGRMPLILIIALLLAFFAAFNHFHLPTVYGWTILVFLFIFPSLFAYGMYKLRNEGLFPIKGFIRLRTFIVLLIGTTGIIAGILLFFYKGPQSSPVKNFRLLGNLPRPISAPDPSRPGNYQVGVLHYGSGKDKRRDDYGKGADIKTPVVDGSVLLKDWKGISGKLRTWYFGFDNTRLPLNAIVWYPKDLHSKAPLVIIVHGNHLAQDYSESGYAYLGELLASKGYIVASIDENFLNISITDISFAGGELENENAARGWMMLKHLELWRKWSDDPSSIFYGKVDTSKVALIGHSRGGEAVGHAALFNRLPFFPDDAREKFDFNFNIRAFIAIAPVDGQYKPSGKLTPLRDINYFVIHGSHDMDMASYGGLGTYKRITYSPGFDGLKAGLYFQLANHGQFNSSWGRQDFTPPYLNRYNETQLMDQKDQQQVAKLYLTSFLELTLRDSLVYKPIFMDYRYAKQWLPNVIYLNQFESSKKVFLLDFEEDMNLSSGSVAEVRITSKNLSVWREQQHKLLFGQELSKAAYIGWDRSENDSLLAEYSINIPDSLPQGRDDKLFVFSLAESEESAAFKPKGKTPQMVRKLEEKNKKDARKDSLANEKQPIDFTIEFNDKKGEKISFLLSDCSYLQPPIKRNLMKFEFLNEGEDAESIPSTFYFDLASLKLRNPGFDMKSLSHIRFIFDKRKSGVIILDDLGFMSR